jgi:hypothetical protein
MVLKIGGLAFFLVPIIMSRLIMFSDIPWIILESISVLGLLILMVVNIAEWKSKR